MKQRPPLLVSAGIIHQNGKVLVGQRRKGDRHSLKWEFPGGKVEYGETPREALVRELWEELHISARVGGELARYEHDYPSGSRVHLLFFSVPEFAGEPVGRVYEQICWIELSALPRLDFLEGDLDFIRRLSRGDFRDQLTLTREAH
ncbi:MAG TPA: (deoxy)nucleoside triphosphate pyrophosphohydrolase [Bryobacteraceae bacterium]|jgi:8-oxo-dGTP diphosphatase|nr:(deoxy)nucleoside triphosphate pyrophosphohydrolase [Bryobacteraceae bacterium]